MKEQDRKMVYYVLRRKRMLLSLVVSIPKDAIGVNIRRENPEITPNGGMINEWYVVTWLEPEDTEERTDEDGSKYDEEE